MNKLNDGNEVRKNFNFLKSEVLDIHDKFNDVFEALSNQMEAFSSIDTMIKSLRDEQESFKQLV